MKYYTRAAERFLNLNWETDIYKDHSFKSEDLAAALEMGYPASLKMCKRNFNLTIEKFYMHCWVAEVKQFLVQPQNQQYKMVKIAHKVGYISRRNFNYHFKYVEGISPLEFWFFQAHFLDTTGEKLVDYERPELEYFMPEDQQPTFFSNFLNAQMQKVIANQKK